MSSETRPMSEAMLAIANLAIALNAHPVNQYEGCWEYQIDDDWWVALNGHKEPCFNETSGGMVPGFSASIQFNGCPAGIIDPFGGCMAHHPNANESALISALNKATSKISGVKMGGGS